MVIFYKKWKKYNEIQLTKNKMDLNIRKMTNHPPSLGISEKYVDGYKIAEVDLTVLLGNKGLLVQTVIMNIHLQQLYVS